jgi:hypothetical protein
VGAPIYECPSEIDADATLLPSSAIDGDVLTATVEHGGGCREHRYSLCYVPMIFTSNPPLVNLRLRHDDGGDACDAHLTQTTRFDLKPLAEYVAPYVQDAENGLVRTNFGMYAWGELTCDERRQLIAGRNRELVERTDRSCVNADDCEGVSDSSSCYAGCGTVLASSAVGDYMSGLEALEQTECEAYAEQDCPAPIAPSCPPGGVVDCVDSVCVLSF